MGTHSKDKLIPDNARRAAQRGFIRTATQTFGGALIAVGAVTGILTADVLLTLGTTLATAAISALIAGGASYFSLLSQGIPEDYAATDPEPTGRMTD